MKTRKILAITGIRSEWDILHPVLKKFEADNNYEVCVLVSGAHLSNFHGFTYNLILESGIRVADRIDNLVSTDRTVQRAKGTGLLTYAISQTVERENPDFIIYVGDREEGIAASIVANYMNVCMIHLAGGDPVYLNADDPVRFAISKLAHVHCTFASEYAENLKKLGEEHFRIICSGNPSLDNIKNTPILTLQELSTYLKLDLTSSSYGVLIKHPLSSEISKSEEQMSITLKALEKFTNQNNFKFIGIYPNTDPGASPILDVIQSFEECKNIHFFKTLPHNIFVNLLRNSSVLAGNSSMGILEAPFYRLPVVNIGNRQTGRLNAGNVVFVKHDINDIVRELHKACFDETYRTYVKNLISPYGDGESAAKIKKFVDTIDPEDNKWLTKHKLI
jgi:GDP/UDP-N,N'-diacetylbacillosamine 2-epimerase (hydrolysing)